MIKLQYYEKKPKKTYKITMLQEKPIYFYSLLQL